MPVLRVGSVANDVVDSLTRHQRVGDACLAVEQRTKFSQLTHELALKSLLLTCAFLTLKSPDPPDVAHGSLDSLHVELVLETNWKPVHWAYRLPGLYEDAIKSLCFGQRSFEEDLV